MDSNFCRASVETVYIQQLLGVTVVLHSMLPVSKKTPSWFAPIKEHIFRKRRETTAQVNQW